MKVKELVNVKYSLRAVPKELSNKFVAKFLFTELFPELNGSVVYMDPDVVVQGFTYFDLFAGGLLINSFTTGDVSELARSQVVPNSLGAFSDDCRAGSASKSASFHGENRYGARLHLKSPSIIELEKQRAISISPKSCTFDTGVFVTSDVDIWRKENISSTILSLMKSHQQ